MKKIVARRALGLSRRRGEASRAAARRDRHAIAMRSVRGQSSATWKPRWQNGSARARRSFRSRRMRSTTCSPTCIASRTRSTRTRARDGTGRAAARSESTQIADKARGRRGGRRVAMIEWIDPLMAAGNWMPTLVEMAGGRKSVRQRRRAFAVDEVRGAGRCRSGRDFDLAVRVRHDRAAQDLPALTESAEWNALKAVRDAARLHGRRQPVLQSAGSANRGVAGNSRRDNASATLFHFGHEGSGLAPIVCGGYSCARYAIPTRAGVS